MKGHEFSSFIHKVGPYAWPGGYSHVLILSDGEVMCFECAKDEEARIRLAAMNSNKFKDGWAPAKFDVLWEGPAEICCNCNKEIHTEYGDPDTVLE